MILCEYLEKFKSKATGSGAFEKTRESNYDRSQKIKIIKKFNEKLDKFSLAYMPEYDISIVTDMLLDLLRNKSSLVLDVESALTDLRNS